ncbi:MAG: hypothetical protein ABID61_00080 [Candidatus Micrarchaeota archaeon]
MYDILKCSVEPSSFGFSIFYNFNTVKNKIISVANLEEALNYKNKKVLVVLQDYKFNEGAIRTIAEKKNLCFLIDIGRLIKSTGISRAVAISKIRNFLRLCVKYGAFYSFASFAESEMQVRTRDELLHIAMLFDLNHGQAKFALKMLQHYLS